MPLTQLDAPEVGRKLKARHVRPLAFTAAYNNENYYQLAKLSPLLWQLPGRKNLAKLESFLLPPLGHFDT